MSRRTQIVEAIVTQLASAPELAGVTITQALAKRLDPEAALPRVTIIGGQERVTRDLSQETRELVVFAVGSVTGSRDTLQPLTSAMAENIEDAMRSVSLTDAEVEVEEIKEPRYDLEKSRLVSAVDVQTVVRYYRTI